MFNPEFNSDSEQVLSHKQQGQIDRQVAAYENAPYAKEVTLPLGDRDFTITIEPYVANPEIMNGTMRLLDYMAEHPELFMDKEVVDMGTGPGTLGIAAALLGAQKVWMPDIDLRAVVNARGNITRFGFDDTCKAVEGDLFVPLPREVKADVQIFNHPFFAGEPVPGKEWTRMMLGGTELMGRFLEEAPKYSKPDAIYLFAWFTLANNEEGLDNNPAKRGKALGYEVVDLKQMKPSTVGLQQDGYTEIYALRYRGN